MAILSTGDEIIRPGEPMRPGMVYDSNARILADAVRELGGEPLRLRHRAATISTPPRGLCTRPWTRPTWCCSPAARAKGPATCRIAWSANSASRASWPTAWRSSRASRSAWRPTAAKPVVVLPGFPTSAIFTFHEFVAPVIRLLGGRPAQRRATVEARLAVKVNSEIGRTEYLLVGLVDGAAADLAAYPMGKGSGSVTAFSRADGFVTIGRHEEIVEAGAAVAVQLLGGEFRVADLVVIGSHCVGPRSTCWASCRTAASARSSWPSARPAGCRRPSAASATWPACTCSIRRPAGTTRRY